MDKKTQAIAKIALLENIWSDSHHQLVQDTLLHESTKWIPSTALGRNLLFWIDTKDPMGYTPLTFSAEHVCVRDAHWKDLLLAFFQSGTTSLISPLEEVLNVLAKKLKWSGEQWLSIKFEQQTLPFKGNWHFDDYAKDTFLMEVSPWIACGREKKKEDKKILTGSLCIAQNQNLNPVIRQYNGLYKPQLQSEVEYSYPRNGGFLFDNCRGQIIHRGPQPQVQEEADEDVIAYQPRLLLQIKCRDNQLAMSVRESI